MQRELSIIMGPFPVCLPPIAPRGAKTNPDDPSPLLSSLFLPRAVTDVNPGLMKGGLFPLGLLEPLEAPPPTDRRMRNNKKGWDGEGGPQLDRGGGGGGGAFHHQGDVTKPTTVKQAGN